MQVFVEEFVPPNVTDPEELNKLMDTLRPICCRLGDDRMYELWGHWPGNRWEAQIKAFLRRNDN